MPQKARSGRPALVVPLSGYDAISAGVEMPPRWVLGRNKTQLFQVRSGVVAGPDIHTHKLGLVGGVGGVVGEESPERK